MQSIVCAWLLISAASIGWAQVIPSAETMEDPLQPYKFPLESRISEQQTLFKEAMQHMKAGRNEAALQMMTHLNELHPELPEPYNNKAVILAAMGNLEEAMRSLEMALQADPEFALAYENLADIHVRMAADAYAKAARLGADTGRKLQIVRTAIAPPSKNTVDALKGTSHTGEPDDRENNQR